MRQELFNYFSEQHGINLLDGDMNEIECIVLGEKEYLRRGNEAIAPGKQLPTVKQLREDGHAYAEGEWLPAKEAGGVDEKQYWTQVRYATNDYCAGAVRALSQAQPIITELQKSLALEHSINAGLQQENERLNKLLHYIPISSNVPDKKGIERDWLWLWEQIELWYGDIKRKETGSEFLKRMQQTFKLEIIKTKE